MHFSSIIDFSSFVQSEWTSEFEERFQFLKPIPSSGVLPNLAVFESHPELFTLEFLVRMAVKPTLIPKETRDLKEQMVSQEKSDGLTYKPIREIEQILKYRPLVCKDEEERELLIKARTLFEQVSTPGAKHTRQGGVAKLFLSLARDARRSPNPLPTVFSSLPARYPPGYSCAN